MSGRESGSVEDREIYDIGFDVKKQKCGEVKDHSDVMYSRLGSQGTFGNL